MKARLASCWWAQEEALLAEVAADNPKNYQLWNYRKRLALQKGPACAQEVSPGWPLLLCKQRGRWCEACLVSSPTKVSLGQHRTLTYAACCSGHHALVCLPVTDC